MKHPGFPPGAFFGGAAQKLLAYKAAFICRIFMVSRKHKNALLRLRSRSGGLAVRISISPGVCFRGQAQKHPFKANQAPGAHVRIRAKTPRVPARGLL